jgi:DNA-binding PadR family transcriptional regulator
MTKRADRQPADVAAGARGAVGAGGAGAGGAGGDGGLAGFGRYAGPATLILSSLADGPKHGYALTKDVEEFAAIRLAPGTLYEALARLESQGLIEALESEDRRRPYRLTAAGATALKAHLAAQARVTEVGLRRLAVNWTTA